MALPEFDDLHLPGFGHFEVHEPSSQGRFKIGVYESEVIPCSWRREAAIEPTVQFILATMSVKSEKNMSISKYDFLTPVFVRIP